MSEHDDILVSKPLPNIDDAERFIMAHGGQCRDYGEEVDLAPLTHHFLPGIYAREIFMPGGTFVTTYIHKFRNPFLITKGHLLIYNELDGSHVEVRAPYSGVTEAGTRRLLYLIEDTVWITFHSTDLTDIEALERHLFEQPKSLTKLIAAKRLAEIE